MADDGKRELWATLLPSSFRGVPFFVESISVTGGRKATAKPIINSDEQIVDDIGMLQRTYAVRGFIVAKYRKANATVADTTAEIQELQEERAAREKKTGVLEKGDLQVGSKQGTIDADYREMRLILTTAFELRGPGKLIHPVEGIIEDLVCKTFSIDESMKEVGIGRFSATFVRETVQPVPEPVVGAKDEVLGKIDEAAAAADVQIEEEWSVDQAFNDAYEFSAEKLSSVYTGALKDVAEAAVTGIDNMEQFQRNIAELEAGVFAVVGDALQVASTVRGVFDSLNGLFPLPAAAFQALQNGFDFGDLDIDFDFSTPSGKQKKKNQGALNASVQCDYLIEAYRVGLDLDYVTTDDVALVETILEAQHRKIVDGDEADDCLKDAMTSLRESFFDFLGAARLTARSLVEEDVATTTPRVLAYMLYENVDDTDSIAGLNDVVAYETISGVVTVLSE